MNHYQEKKEALYQCMEELVKQDLCIAFSGGVDSSLLIKLAKLCADRQQTGTRIYAVTFDTMLHPACDLEPVAGHIFCRSHMQAAAEDAVAFSFAEIGGCGKVRDGDLFGKMFVHIDHHRLYLIPGAAGRSGRFLKYRRCALTAETIFPREDPSD